MGTLSDTDLTHLMGEAATSFDLPEGAVEDVLEQYEGELAPVVPLRARRLVQLSGAAAVVAAALFVGLQAGGGGVLSPAASRDGFVGGVGGGRDFAADEQAGAGGGDSDAIQRSPDLSAGGTVGLSGGRAASGESLSFSTAAGAAGRAPAPAAAAPNTKTVPLTAPEADGARVVKRGAIALIVADGQVTPTLTKVQQVASSAGGDIANAKTQESGPTPSGAVTLRVPVDQFEEVVAAVRGLKAEVRSATTSGQDVTAQYSDLEVQIKTLSAARERFLDILSRARTIGDVLAVQQRVDDATGKIDRLEGQRRLLASQSETATLEVTVTEKDDPVVAQTQKSENGLTTAVKDGWEGFTSGVEGLIRLSGRGILLLLCLAVAAVVLRFGVRSVRRAAL